MSPWLMVLLALALIVLILATVRRVQFSRLGYRVCRANRDQIAYEEKTRTGVRRVILDGEMLTGEKNVVFLPDAESWPREVPEWARDRRTEIVGRVKSLLGEKKYTFES